MRITIPKMFWEDHYERCADHDGKRKAIRTIGNSILVELDEEAFADLLSDADLYATPKQFPSEYASLCRSAKATLYNLKQYKAARAIG